MKSLLRYLAIVSLLVASALRADALSFALDSVAEWGQFPKFCVDVYRWGDKFFNGYDTTFVKGTGYKFNVKFKTDSWVDYYNFRLQDKTTMVMHSDPSTSMGMYLTYLAVSAGYDVNVSKLFNGNDQRRTRFNFGFNCSLLAAEWSYTRNDVGTTIKSIRFPNTRINDKISFNGINASEWNLQVYYFFNHKKYSQAAAFNFARIQERSNGSFYAGLFFSNQRYDFDFRELSTFIESKYSHKWPLDTYKVSSYNYAFRLGYGYNWVFAKHWLFAVSESPIVGLRRGLVNNDTKGNSFAMANSLRMSIVWNNGRWFAGMVGNSFTNIIYNKEQTFISSYLSGEVSVGLRFNLW